MHVPKHTLAPRVRIRSKMHGLVKNRGKLNSAHRLLRCHRTGGIDSMRASLLILAALGFAIGCTPREMFPGVSTGPPETSDQASSVHPSKTADLANIEGRADTIMIRDKSGAIYTFFHEGTHISFVQGDEPHAVPEKRIRIKRFPGGFLDGLFARFEFIDDQGNKWQIRASDETLLAFMEWTSAERPLRDMLPIELKTALNDAETAGEDFDLLFEVRVAPIERQKDLDEKGWGIVALSKQEVFVATQIINLSPAFPKRAIKVPFSQISFDLVSDLPLGAVSTETRGFAAGYVFKTGGQETVCRVKTQQGHILFLQLRVTDLKTVQSRIAGDA